jgi:hypothetical protein
MSYLNPKTDGNPHVQVAKQDFVHQIKNRLLVY